jgi:DNA-binding transcriptional ArsR family regulator
VKALRIAGLLSSLDDEPKKTIQLRHWYRGRAITERWRASLHRLVLQLHHERRDGESREATVEQLIERALRRSGSLSIREMSQKIRATYGELNKSIQVMMKAGIVTVDGDRSGRTTRYGLIIQSPNGHAALEP